MSLLILDVSREFSLTVALGSQDDIELSQNAIEFVSRVMSRDPLMLLELDPQKSLSFFVFTLGVLDGREPLPKASAMDFWVSSEVEGH